MKGNKETFTENKTFHKEYTKSEFLFLKMLHGSTGLVIGLTPDHKYITMPHDHVISIDTIPQKRRSNINHIIIENIPFILKQVSLLNQLGIYYSDCMQFLYHDNKMYLIDMDTAFFHDSEPCYNNYDLLLNFLTAFNIDSSIISKSLYYLELFRTEDIEWTFYNDSEKELYNKWNKPDMIKNHVYYSRNDRMIQGKFENIQITLDHGTVCITENILSPENMNEWELIKIA